MNYVILFPYIAVIIIFVILLTLSYYKHQKFIRYMKREAEKAKIYLRILKLDAKYTELVSQKMFQEYPRILASLNEIKLLKDLGVEMDLRRISIIPIRMSDGGYEKNVKPLIEEFKRAPNDIKNVINEKLQIVNEVGRLKHPSTSWMTHLLMRMTLNTSIHILLALCWILKKIDKYNKESVNRKNRIEDAYFIAFHT